MDSNPKHSKKLEGKINNTHINPGILPKDPSLMKPGES